MQIPGKKDIEALANIQSKYCVSIVIPTHRKGVEVNEYRDAKLLKSHLHSAKHAIMETGGKSDDETTQILQPAYNLVEDTDFWHHQSDSLAVFIADDGTFQYFRLPYHVDETRFLSDSFHLQELIPALNRGHLYYILGLDLQGLTLYEATENYIHEIDLKGVAPQQLQDVLKYYDFEKTAEGRAPQSGHYQAKDQDEEPYLREYFEKVHDGIVEMIENKDKNPVVLAGVEYLHPVFKEVNKKLKIPDEGITGNPSQLKEVEIHSKSWAIAGKQFEKDKTAYLDKYNELIGTGYATNKLEELIPAAKEGRVKALFVNDKAHVFGQIHDDNQVDIHDQFKKEDHCLISESAIETLLHNGDVYLENPEKNSEINHNHGVAAIYRY